MTTIGIDLDGVIHLYSQGWRDGSIYDAPVPEAFGVIKNLMEGHAVFVLTARNPEQYNYIAAWIEKESGIPCEVDFAVTHRSFWNTRGKLLITNRKYPAIAYIDDRAIPFTSWDQVPRQIEELKNK